MTNQRRSAMQRWILVDGVHQSGKGNIFLNMGGKYPNQAFSAFIPSSSAAQFPNPQQYEGRDKWTFHEGRIMPRNETALQV